MNGKVWLVGAGPGDPGLFTLKGKKVLPIVYDKKTLHVLEDNKCRNYVELGQLDHIDTDSLPDKAERLPEEQREYLIRAAEGQFEKLNELLEDR